MDSSYKNEYELEAARLRTHRQNLISDALIALLENEASFADKISKRCHNVYLSYKEYDFVDELTKLANENELRCLRYRKLVDEMHHAAKHHNDIYRYNLPEQADISADMTLSYDEEVGIFRVRFPILLPLKPTWNAYLPDKVRRKVEQFTDEYRAKAWEERQVYAIPQFAKAVVLLIHHYDDERRVKNHFRDYDNQEWSWVLNALCSQRLFNDHPARMISVNMAVKDTESFTEVIVTRPDRILDALRTIDPGIDISLYDTGGGAR